MAGGDPTQKIRVLFRKTLVIPMAEIERGVASRSRRSLFRDLTSLGYLSSYTHSGRYFTLPTAPAFDVDGLWRWQGIGFSREGSLQATVAHLVERSDTGWTQRELQLRLGARAHNALLERVESKRLGRQKVQGQYVYFAAEGVRARTQFDGRRALGAVGAELVPTALEVEILLELIHGVRGPPEATTVAARLQARGLDAPVTHVVSVLERYDFEGKKTASCPSRRSRR
jgi:hypothetical protein